jgi:hypothetical protein
MVKHSKSKSILAPLGLGLIGVAIAIGIITRLVAVFQYVTFDIGPDPDQIRDAFAVMGIWSGDFPLIGPSAYGLGLGGFNILPLYYYLFFPFTLLGGAPVFQALPNALFSFLSIPLFIYLIYQLLEQVEFPTRVFLSGLAGLWHSILFGDIFIANFQWNPSSLVFFFLLFTALYDLALKHLFSWGLQIPIWIGIGVVLSILVSLHSAALFVMPIVFVMMSLMFGFKVLSGRGGNSRLMLPVLGALASVVSLAPYWLHEYRQRLGNTRAIFRTIASASGSGDEESLPLYLWFWDKITNLILQPINTVRQVYFWDASIPYLIISVLFLLLVAFISFQKFKGNWNIWQLWLATWGLLLLAAANIDPVLSVFYYKSLMMLAPIVLAVIAIAYLDWPKPAALAFYGVITFFVVVSFSQNLFYDYQFMASKYGDRRLMNTRELAQVMTQLPAGSTICDPRIARRRSVRNQYNYIDTYVTHNDLDAVEECQAGHYIVHPKRILWIEGNFLNQGDYQETYIIPPADPEGLKLWPILEIVDNQAFEPSADLFMETETAFIYRLS